MTARVCLGAGALWTAHAAKAYADAVQPPEVLHTGSPRLQRILARCPRLWATFWPSPPLSNANVAIATAMQLRTRRVGEVAFERQIVAHADGGESALDWARHRAPPGSHAPTRPHARKGTLVFMHTVTATRPEAYGLADFVLEALACGWEPVVHVRRGCGGLRLRSLRWNPLGCADDLDDALAAVRAARPEGPIVCVALSAGCAPLARYLGDKPERADQIRIAGAVMIAPAYSMPAAWELVRWPYSQIVTRRLQHHFLAGHNRAVFQDHPAYSAAMAASSLPAFFSAVMPLCGYADLDTFIEQCDPGPVRRHIRVPTLAINSLNDPLAVRDNIDRHFFGSGVNGQCALATVRRGSHIEFFEWREGAWTRPWAMDVALEFVASAVADAELAQGQERQASAVPPRGGA